MSGEQQIACIQVISTNIQQITATKFPAYGSLYFASMYIGSALKVPLAQGFCVGPHCGTRYWDCNVGEARHYISIKPNRGPCRFSLLSVLLTGLRRL